ncbi:I20L2 protein, partial [Cardinalis cardinalis]|nr:I20L2 protein [Cardinalis cardinalis]
PGRRSGAKPRSGRRCPKENGAATTPRCSPVSQNGPAGSKGKARGAAQNARGAAQNGDTGTGAPAQGKGKARGTALGAPPVSRNGPTGTGAKGKARGAGSAPPAPPKLVALDCEMVGTGPGGRTSALARCSIVTYEGD